MPGFCVHIAGKSSIDTGGHARTEWVVRPAQRLLPLWCVVLLALLPMARLSAQSLFLAERDGHMYPVKRMNGLNAYVSVDDRILHANGPNCGLADVEDFIPVLVTVRDFQVRTRYIDAGNTAINNDFEFHATFTSPTTLEDVFLVLDLKAAKSGHSLAGYGFGRLEAGVTRRIDITVPLRGEMGAGTCVLHLFSNGLELLNSEMPAAYRDRALDRLIAKRIASVKRSEVVPLIGSAPEYPERLKKSNLTGHTLVTLHIDRRGHVVDPEVVQASDPDFGEAALAAVREWRFLPRVRDGHPVDCKINIPFDFVPPSGRKEKS